MPRLRLTINPIVGFANLTRKLLEYQVFCWLCLLFWMAWKSWRYPVSRPEVSHFDFRSFVYSPAGGFFFSFLFLKLNFAKFCDVATCDISHCPSPSTREISQIWLQFFREESRPNFKKESCYIFGGTYCLNIVNSEFFFPSKSGNFGCIFLTSLWTALDLFFPSKSVFSFLFDDQNKKGLWTL